MTRLVRKTPSKTKPRATSRVWQLQDAKARFSELVRRACDAGPQRITVHGKDAVVVVSAEQFDSLSASMVAPKLSELLRNSPLSEIEFDFAPTRSSIRDVEL